MVLLPPSWGGRRRRKVTSSSTTNGLLLLPSSPSSSSSSSFFLALSSYGFCLLLLLVHLHKVGSAALSASGAAAGASRPQWPVAASSASSSASSSPSYHGRQRPPRVMPAWGETWEMEDDFWERLGGKVLDFVLRRKPPEEPHPLRMQRWTIRMRRGPLFFRRVVRHMQFYPDGTCEVEEEIGGPQARRVKKIVASIPNSSNDNGKRKRRKKTTKKPTSSPAGPVIKGKWKYDKYGLNWELEESGVRNFYHAELIWHSFGSRPKMHCGIIVRNRRATSLLPPWFLRPVVGVFNGLGNGTDTHWVEATSSDGRFNNY